MRGVLDTNVVLYLLGGRLAEGLPAGEYLTSVITEMELLSYPSLTKEEERQIRSFLGEVRVIGLGEEVKERAIELRRKHGMKLPDAIVAATALAGEAELCKNDRKMGLVPELKVRSLPLNDDATPLLS